MPSSMVKLRHPPASSGRVGPGLSEDLMSLEDFLAESDKTPNRVRLQEAEFWCRVCLCVWVCTCVCVCVCVRVCMHSCVECASCFVCL